MPSTTPTTDTDGFADRAAAATRRLASGPTDPVRVHTAADERRADAARARREASETRTAAMFVGHVVATGAATAALAVYTPATDATLLAVLLAGSVGSVAAFLRDTARTARRHPLPDGILLHGHAAAAYHAILEGPRQLRDVGAPEHAVGRGEALAPVAEHLAATLGDLGTPAEGVSSDTHRRLLEMAGEVVGLVETARDHQRAVTEAVPALVATGSLADVAADLAAETDAALMALDRAAGN